jgi:hypothetical protein
MAFWLLVNGLDSQRPSLPGALLVALVGAPATFDPPRSGRCEKRGNRKARISSTTQKATTMAMVMQDRYPRAPPITRPQGVMRRPNRAVAGSSGMPNPDERVHTGRHRPVAAMRGGTSKGPLTPGDPQGHPPTCRLLVRESRAFIAQSPRDAKRPAEAGLSACLQD